MAEPNKATMQDFILINIPLSAQAKVGTGSANPFSGRVGEWAYYHEKLLGFIQLQAEPAGEPAHRRSYTSK